MVAFRLSAISAAALALTSFAAPALAQVDSDFVTFTFTGTVAKSVDDSITLRNPDNSTTTLTGDQIPGYRYDVGDKMVTTFTFAANQPAFADSRCGGRYTLGFANQNPGSCFVELSKVVTPFGQVGLGGSGGDAWQSITGLELYRNEATGAYSVDMPTGSYSMRYVGVNPYYYDSATGELKPPNNNICVNTFNCPDGVITGTATGWTTNVAVAGDFGKVQPGYNVGYLAGNFGGFSVSGLFDFGGGSDPVDVPEPSSLLLFSGAAALIARRQRRKNGAA